MAAEETLDILRRTPIVGLFEETALRVIANVGDSRRLRPGEILFREGERSDGGYVVTAGTIDVAQAGGHAASLGPSSLIGRIALFSRMHRPGTATARDAATVLRISPTLMKRVLQEYPAAAAGMARALADDLAETQVDLAEAERLLARLGNDAAA